MMSRLFLVAFAIIAGIDNLLLQNTVTAQNIYDSQTQDGGGLSCPGNPGESPIEIDTSSLTEIPSLEVETIVAPTPSIARLGVGSEFPILEDNGDSIITINGNSFVFRFASLHYGKNSSVGSQHVINGQRYPLEMSWAGEGDTEIIILNVLFEISATDNADIAEFITLAQRIADGESAASSEGQFEYASLFPNDLTEYYKYDGTITVLACFPVTQYIFKNTVAISESQMTIVRSMLTSAGNVFGDTFRVLQSNTGIEVFQTEVPTSIDSWSYSGADGPSFWHLYDANCGGSKQSPIDFNSDTATPATYDDFCFLRYRTDFDTLTLTNNGHAAQVNIVGESLPVLSGGGLDGDYELIQFHCHWGSTDLQGSEHTIDGVKYPLEMHFVHKSTKYADVATALTMSDGLAVTGVLFQITEHDNSNLWGFFNNLCKIQNKGDETDILLLLEVNALYPNDKRSFFRYEGSLTTPGCNEAVIWTVFREPVGVSSAQLAHLRELLEADGVTKIVDNFRPVQAIGTREITYNVPACSNPSRFSDGVCRC